MLNLVSWSSIYLREILTEKRQVKQIANFVFETRNEHFEWSLKSTVGILLNYIKKKLKKKSATMCICNANLLCKYYKWVYGK